jgi:hypothetical protein
MAHTMVQGLMPRGVNRYDLIEGQYYWLLDHQEGKRSAAYARLCHMRTYYTPTRLFVGPDEGGQEVYDALCTKAGCCQEVQ